MPHLGGWRQPGIVLLQVSGLSPPCFRRSKVGAMTNQRGSSTPPGRPDHPDFARLRDLVNGLDEATERDGRLVVEVIAETLDEESATYMAIQRALRLNQATGLPVEALASIWLEGLIVGARFAADAQPPTPPPGT